MFAEQVDFVSGDVLAAGGELLIATPLGVLGASAGSDAVDVVTLHPGVSFEDIQALTGFSFTHWQAVTTLAPNAAELAALRGCAHA